MKHRIPTEYRFAKLIFREDWVADILINVYDQDGGEIDIEHIKLDLAPEILRSLQSAVDTELKQMEQEDNVSRVDKIPGSPPPG